MSSNNNNLDSFRGVAPTRIPRRTGQSELYIGCMASGKSTRCKSEKDKHQRRQRNVLTTKHSSDNRYETGKLTTHDDPVGSHDVLMITDLSEIDTILKTDERYQNIHVIQIDEINFFNTDAEIFAKKIDEWANDGYIVQLFGLQADWKRREFGPLRYLIPQMDEIHQLRACCAFCKAENASHSIRLDINDKKLISVGGLDEYAPACRSCYLRFHNPT